MKKADNMENTLKDSPRQGRFLAEMRRQSVELMAAISGTRQEMIRTLKEDLSAFMSALGIQGQRRKAEARDAALRRADDRKELGAGVDGLLRDAGRLVSDLGENRRKMTETLKQELSGFMSALGSREDTRKAEARDAALRRVDREKQIGAEVDGLRQEAGRLVSELGENRRKMAETLKQGLSAFMAELAAGNSRRKAEAKDAAERRQAVAEDRKKSVRELGGDTKRMLKEISGNQRTMAGELRRGLSEFKAGLGAGDAARRARRAEDIPQEKAVSAPTAEVASAPSAEAVSAPPAEKAADPAAGFRDKEKVKDRIVKVVEMHPDGIKMVQVAETLGVENWRALIPVMRELCDEELLGKEGPLYFV